MARQRLAGLDLFRGLAVVGMILVNTPGSGEHVWWPLDHAAWHGFTPTDLVFPAFLCAMGFALGLSFPRVVAVADWTRIARRTLLLIAIGWAWQMLARPGLETFRLHGVLPRLGLCYAAAAALAILTAHRGPDGRRHLSAAAIGLATLLLLGGYWAAMALVPVPGHGAGVLTPEGNLAGYVDRLTIGTAHIWRFGTDAAGNIVYDPEGLLSTLPALANVLLGMLAALLWQRAPDRPLLRIALAAAAIAALGLAIAPWFPLNKKLWTSSYALLSSGLAGLIFVLCEAGARQAGLRRAAWPLEVFGKNAILAYVGSLLIGLAAMRSGVQAAGFVAIRGVVAEPYLASFLYAVAVLGLVLALLIPLHRRGMFLRL